MQAMGKSAGNYFTPEEKLQFSFWLDERASKAGNDELATVFLPAAEAAVLPDLQARWLKQLVAECAAKHQMLEAMQRRMIDTACAGMAMMPQPFVYQEVKKDGK